MSEFGAAIRAASRRERDPDGKVNLIRVEPTISPAITIPRPVSLDDLDPFAAAMAVGEFIGSPAKTKRWSIERFDITQEQAYFDFMRSYGDGKGRWSGGCGDFLALKRLHPSGGPEGSTGGEMVMSNTPTEMADHSDVLEHATGRVLIHGLGLSCVVSGLLAKPDVEHIDVVEIEPDVIELVGAAYSREPRVTIHRGSCLNYRWPADARWDYVWHDIWSGINPDNIDTPDAEFGISYECMFRLFADRAERQGAWAYEDAIQARERRAEADREKEEFAAKWPDLNPDQRYELLIEWQAKHQFAVPGVIERDEETARDDFRQFLAASDTMEQTLRRIAATDDPPNLLLF